MIRRIVELGWRQLILLTAMLAFSGLIARNLFYWQVTEHAHISSVAARVYDSETNVPAKRGLILDATGEPLVMDVPAFLVAADPSVIASSLKRYYAAKLARVLHRDPGPILAILQTPVVRYVVIAHQVDDATAGAIRAISLPNARSPGLPGIIIAPTYRAEYPQGPVASSVLGFVNASGVGQYGLEQAYNQVLAGHDGSQLVYVDTSNRPLPVGVERPRPAVPGATLILTINAAIQTMVEQRLAAAIQKYGAENGTAIVMDPHTGAILAMASLPSYDPNHYTAVAQTNPGLFNNLALESYQPGSTFKIVSVSAGLDSGSFTPSTTVNDPGFYQNYGMTVRNWEVGTGWGVETPEIMLQHSANVGMAQFANIMGPTTFYHYVVGRFGFNAPTGIDLPDESSGLVRTPWGGQPWQMMDLLTNSYGQGINVTPLQLTTAVAALANGGVRMRPYVVQRIQYQYPTHHTWVARPHVAGRAVSAATANTMTGILKESAYDGEAMCALTNGYPVAAKTGTATIEGPAAHGMNLTGGTVASLIGYAPANNPRFVMLVTLTRPHLPNDGNHIWGSTTAAPVWHDIAVQLYRLLGILPVPGATQPDLVQKQGPTDYGCEFQAQTRP